MGVAQFPGLGGLAMATKLEGHMVGGASEYWMPVGLQGVAAKLVAGKLLPVAERK